MIRLPLPQREKKETHSHFLSIYDWRSKMWYSNLNQQIFSHTVREVGFVNIFRKVLLIFNYKAPAGISLAYKGL